MNPTTPTTPNSHSLSQIIPLRTTAQLHQTILANRAYLQPQLDYPVENLSGEAQAWLRKPLSLSTIQNLERAERAESLDRIMRLTVGQLLKLCKGLGCRPGDIWEGLR